MEQSHEDSNSSTRTKIKMRCIRYSCSNMAMSHSMICGQCLRKGLDEACRNIKTAGVETRRRLGLEAREKADEEKDTPKASSDSL